MRQTRRRNREGPRRPTAPPHATEPDGLRLPSGAMKPEALTFVGIGLGPIQTGLFLFEAQRSGSFDRLVVAEVDADVVQRVRAAGGLLTIHVAGELGVESHDVGPIEIYDPNVPKDRTAIVEALSVASEAATAVPSVQFYRGEGDGSIDRLIASSLAQRAMDANEPRYPLLVYAAENDNHAAEALEHAVRDRLDARTDSDPSTAAVVERAAFVNTVIGKMSGVLSALDAAERGLAPLVAGLDRVHLVESFARILISQPPSSVIRGAVVRGIGAFVEKPDLLPFEEAKLYGHNAVHALGAYLAHARGLTTIAELRAEDGAMEFLRDAFVEESGAGLIHRHAGVDELFTLRGFSAYADDLLVRMVNPHLGDLVARVARDPARKLGWNDRLVGTARLALAAGVTPRRFALGIAAALEFAGKSVDWLRESWTEDPRSEATHRERIVSLVRAARDALGDVAAGRWSGLDVS